MIKKAYNLLRLLRPRQWIKNLAIFAAITFSGQLFDVNILYKVILGFFVFCGLSSASYIVNDIFDREKDRLHPFKKFRPLAHNDISVPFASTVALILVASSLLLALNVNPAFFLLTVLYLILQLSYSVVLKSITVI